MSRSMRDALLRAGAMLALSPLAWGQAVVDWGSCRSFCSQTEIGNALIENRGQMLHVAGSLTVDRWQGSERVQMRVTDVAVPDPGPRVIR